jgi:hypothetical protein
MRQSAVAATPTVGNCGWARLNVYHIL